MIYMCPILIRNLLSFLKHQNMSSFKVAVKIAYQVLEVKVKCVYTIKISAEISFVGYLKDCIQDVLMFEKW